MRSKLAIRLVNNPTIEAFKSSIKLKVAEAPRYLQTIKDENKKIFFHKLGSLNKWYNNIIGLDEVNVYLERVAALQKELLTTQEKRREIGGQLNEIRQKSNEVQDKIQQVDRKEKFNVYCELIKEEREIIFLERTATNKFQEYDQMERDLFTAFTNAVRDSNEKQRAQVEYTKYLGFILSITEVRKEEVLAIRNRFPTKIPVIVQRFFKETHLPQLDKSKFLVPQEITMSQFQTIIRNRIHLNKNQALYLLVNNKSMMSLSLTLAEVYTEHSENDGFLYVTYASQEVFGVDTLREDNMNESHRALDI